MADRVYNVLFICSGNSARSILAEAILRHEGADHFRAFSAGSEPKGSINPYARKILEARHLPTDGFRSKSWDEFTGPDAPVMDFVFTLCDETFEATCPKWPGSPVTSHWGIEDPVAVEGADLVKEAAFELAFKYMRRRISAFVALLVAGLDTLTLNKRLREIGTLPGSSLGLHNAYSQAS